MTWVDRLRHTKQSLPADLRDEILALGADAVPGLIEVLLDHSLAHENDRCPPSHAATLLAELRAPESFEPMIRVIARRSSDMIFEAVTDAFEAFGSAALEVCLRLASDSDAEVREMALEALAHSRAPDSRAWDALVLAFERDPRIAADQLVIYGDARARALLERAIESLSAGQEKLEGDPWSILQHLVPAYEEIGGAISPDLRRRMLEAHYASSAELWSEDSAEAADRSRGERFLELAEPLAEQMPDASYEERLKLAWGVFERAAMPASDDEARIDEMMPEGLRRRDAKRLRWLYRLMFRRHRLLFPELAPEGPEPEKDLLDSLARTTAPHFARVLGDALANGEVLSELVLVVERSPERTGMFTATRHKVGAIFEASGWRESLRRSVLGAIERITDETPVVFVAHTSGTVIAGVRRFRARSLLSEPN